MDLLVRRLAAERLADLRRKAQPPAARPADPRRSWTSPAFWRDPFAHAPWGAP